jgi:hypothetical protein
MGRQIIKQPDGLFAVWSSVVDNFIMVNCTPQEIIDEYVKDETERIAKSVTEDIQAIENGEKPYLQFTKTWDEALVSIEDHHGQKAVKELKDFMKGPSKEEVLKSMLGGQHDEDDSHYPNQL